MADRELVAVATNADIDRLKDKTFWEPVILGPEMDQCDVINLLNAEEDEVACGIIVKEWKPVSLSEDGTGLWLPMIEDVVEYADPIVIEQRFYKTLNEGVWGNPIKPSMLQRNELHMHDADALANLEEEHGFRHVTTTCIQNSIDLRANGFWKTSVRALNKVLHIARQGGGAEDLIKQLRG